MDHVELRIARESSFSTSVRGRLTELPDPSATEVAVPWSWFEERVHQGIPVATNLILRSGAAAFDDGAIEAVSALELLLAGAIGTTGAEIG